MLLYFAEIEGVRAAVDPNGTIEVWIVEALPSAGQPMRAQWIGKRTWREVAVGFEGKRLVTRAVPLDAEGRPRKQRVARDPGPWLSIRCERDDSLAAGEELPLSCDERALILEQLRATGRPDLAERCAPILDRVTRTDPPPPPDPKRPR